MGPRAYFAVFLDHRANVDPVSPLDWTLLCLSKVLTGIRDEREVRSSGARPFFLPRAETPGIPGLGPKFDERYPLVAVRTDSYIYGKLHYEIKLNNAAT